MSKFFPMILMVEMVEMVEMVAAAVVYAAFGDWRHAAYWACGAGDHSVGDVLRKGL